MSIFFKFLSTKLPCKGAVIFSLLALIFSSCSNKKAALNLYYEENLLGSSSLEIFKKYDLANQIWRDSKNNSFLSYSYTKPKYSLASFLPLLDRKTQFDNYEVILMFDQNGKLVEIKKFHDKIFAKSWIICESKNFNCDQNREIISRK